MHDCDLTGFKGRTGIYEILKLDNDIKESIDQGASIVEIERTAISKGFKNFNRSALELITSGVTDYSEVSRVLTITTEEPEIDTELGLALQRVFTPLSALAFLVFVLLYVPCVATLGTIRSEFGTRWAVFSALYQTGVAWIMSVAVFQIGLILGYV